MAWVKGYTRNDCGGGLYIQIIRDLKFIVNMFKGNDDYAYVKSSKGCMANRREILRMYKKSHVSPK